MSIAIEMRVKELAAQLEANKGAIAALAARIAALESDAGTTPPPIAPPSPGIRARLGRALDYRPAK